MSLLQNILTRIAALVNVEPKIGIAIADDGTGNAITAGQPTPLRADPTTGALIVTSAAGAALGAVTQGTGDATKPWYVQGVDGGIAERLAVDRTAANAPSVTRASNGTSFVDLVLDATVTAGNVILAAIRDRLPVSVGGKTSANSLSVTMATDQSAIPSSNAAATQADGHSATIGATADADTAMTLVGRLKKILATLIDGTQVAIAKGPVAVGAAVGSEKPVLIGGSDGGSLARVFRTNTTGALHTISPAGTSVVGTAFEASKVISASPVEPSRVQIHNRAAGLRWMMAFNATSLPADGAIPVDIVSVAADTTAQIDYPHPSGRYSVGCVLALSSTNSSLTVGLANGLFSATIFPRVA